MCLISITLGFKETNIFIVEYLLNKPTIYYSTSTNKLFVLNYRSFCLTIDNLYS